MRILSVNLCIVSTVFLISFQEVVSQSLYPYQNQVPIVYGDSGDDDYGILLAILLLASRNRGGWGGGCGGSNCGCCGCCNCGNGGQNIPIPYPIPFPTNNPIVMTRHYDRRVNEDDDEDDGKNDDRKRPGRTDNSDQTINVITEDVQQTSNKATGGKSRSGSSSSAKDRNRRGS